jgi:predicted transcriptional regulator
VGKRFFGSLEIQILQILKSMGKRATVKEVHLALGGQDNYNTIMTVMTRLAQKEKLSRERVGLQYEYWLAPNSSSVSLFDKMKEKIFGVKTASFVSYLISSADDLSDEDLAEMEKTLQLAKAKREKS